MNTAVDGYGLLLVTVVTQDPTEVPLARVLLRGSQRTHVFQLVSSVRSPDARCCDIEGFSHVRLCERHYAPRLGDEPDTDHAEWIVSLEGPVPYAFDDGRVHTRSDAVELVRFRSGRGARRLAAEVAYHAGLRILEATDW
jgi:hypothetical protein